MLGLLTLVQLGGQAKQQMMLQLTEADSAFNMRSSSMYTYFIAGYLGVLFCKQILFVFRLPSSVVLKSRGRLPCAGSASSLYGAYNFLLGCATPCADMGASESTGSSCAPEKCQGMLCNGPESFVMKVDFKERKHT